MNNIALLVKVKMLERMKRELAKLERAKMEMPNEEVRADIELHRRIINFLLNII